jgi:hypothetical protein
MTRNSKISQARLDLRGLFSQDVDGVYLVKMFKVMEENLFPHWTMEEAIEELLEDGYLDDHNEPLQGGTTLRFFFKKGNVNYMETVKKAVPVMKKYSDPLIVDACEDWTKTLVEKAFSERGFAIVGKQSNSYRGKSWTESDHSLDFIIERDGRAYGCVVKNTFEYIDEEELGCKLKGCECLDLTPLFIMISCPENFKSDIVQRDGYVMTMRYKFYPPGYEALVEEIWQTVYLPVKVRESLPTEIMDEFEKWHEKANGS